MSSYRGRGARRVDERFGGTHALRVRVSAAAARASGRVMRADLDEHGLLLPGTLAVPPGALVGHRLVRLPHVDLKPERVA